MSEPSPTPQTYPDLLATLKARIRDARLRTAVSVNRELILLYWDIGRDILLRQAAEGWGTAVMLPLTTGPLIVADQDVTRADNFGTSR